MFLEMGLDGPALKRFPPSAYVCDPGKSRPSARPFLFFFPRPRKKLFRRGVEGMSAMHALLTGQYHHLADFFPQSCML